MSLPRIASLLLSRLDSLLSAVAGDEALVDSLRRERQRLVAHITRHAEELLHLERPLLDAVPGLPALPPQPRPLTLRPQQVAHIAERFRLSCYSALDGGLLDARRFDILLLLGARAQKRGRPLSAYADSSSASASSSGGEDTGAVSVGSVPAGSGRSGGIDGALPGNACWRPGASLRKNLMSSSTMRPCV